MPTSPVSGGAQIPKPQLISYLVQRGLSQVEAQRVADTVDPNSSAVQFKDGQIVTDGSGVSVSLSDGSLSKEELAAMGFTPANETDETLIHGWAEKDKEGYQADGSAEAESIEAEDLGQMFADVDAYARAYGIEFDQALTIYLSQEADLSRQSVAGIQANREARANDYQLSINARPSGQGYADWAKGTLGVPENDPILQNLAAYVTANPNATPQDIAKQLLLYAFASRFSANIQKTVLGLSTPMTRSYQGNYDAASLNAWHKNEQPATPATAAAGAPDAAPASQTPEQRAESLVAEGKALEEQGQNQEAMDKYLEAYALLDPYGAMALEVNAHIERTSALLYPASPDSADPAETMDFTTDEPSPTGAPAAPVTLAILPPAPTPQMFGGAVGRLEFIYEDRPNVSFRIDYQGQTFTIDKNTDPAQVRALLYAKFGSGQEAAICTILDQVHQMVTGSANSSVWKNGSIVLNLSSMAAHYMTNNYAFHLYYGNEQPFHFPAAGTQVAQAQVSPSPVAAPTSQPETHPGGTLADASTYDVDGGPDYQPSPAEQEIYAQIFAELEAGNTPPPAASTPAVPAPVVAAAQPEAPAPTISGAGIAYTLTDEIPLDGEPTEAEQAIYEATIAMLEAGNTPPPAAPTQVAQAPVEAAPAPVAAEVPAPPAEPYNFSDDLVSGELLANLEHPHGRPMLSTIIHDRQPVAPAVEEEPTAVAAVEVAPVEADEPPPTPTPVTVVADNNGNNGGVVYGTPAFAPNIPPAPPAPAPAPDAAVGAQAQPQTPLLPPEPQGYSYFDPSILQGPVVGSLGNNPSTSGTGGVPSHADATSVEHQQILGGLTFTSQVETGETADPAMVQLEPQIVEIIDQLQSGAHAIAFSAGQAFTIRAEVSRNPMGQVTFEVESSGSVAISQGKLNRIENALNNANLAVNGLTEDFFYGPSESSGGGTTMMMVHNAMIYNFPFAFGANEGSKSSQPAAPVIQPEENPDLSGVGKGSNAPAAPALPLALPTTYLGASQQKYQQAVALYNQGKYQQAIAAFRSLRADGPDGASTAMANMPEEALIGLAICYYQLHLLEPSNPSYIDSARQFAGILKVNYGHTELAEVINYLRGLQEQNTPPLEAAGAQSNPQPSPTESGSALGGLAMVGSEAVELTPIEMPHADANIETGPAPEHQFNFSAAVVESETGQTNNGNQIDVGQFLLDMTNKAFQAQVGGKTVESQILSQMEKVAKKKLGGSTTSVEIPIALQVTVLRSGRVVFGLTTDIFDPATGLYAPGPAGDPVTARAVQLLNQAGATHGLSPEEVGTHFTQTAESNGLSMTKNWDYRHGTVTLPFVFELEAQ